MSTRSYATASLGLVPLLCALAGACGEDPPTEVADLEDGGGRQPGSDGERDGAALADGGADGPRGLDASNDGGPDARTDSGSDSSVDSGIDAPAPPSGPTTALVMAFGSGAVYGTKYHAGAWDALTNVALDGYYQGGGGLTATSTGGGFGFFRTGSSLPPRVTTYGGAWTAASAVGTQNVNYVGAPVVTSTKLLLPITMAGVGGQINLGSFDIGTAAWTMQPTGAGVAVAVTSSGDAVIAFGGRSTQYAWTKRTAAGAWSSSQVIAGVGVSSFFGQAPVPVLVKRANVDEIVGLFVTEATNKTTLDATTFSGGAWSAPTPIATDLLVSFGPERPMAAAALPDGRVAIAYLVGAPGLGKAIKVGFLSGATWGPFDAVPGVSAAHGAIDLALAPGTDGAMLEMVYVDSAYALRHTRLTAGGTWTLPTTIDTSRSYAFVSLVTL